MAFAWIELDHEQSGWGPTRVLVAKLSRDGYVVQVLIGPDPKVLIVTGKRLSPARLTAIGRPAPGRQAAGLATGGLGIVKGLKASAHLLARGMSAGQHGQDLLVVAAGPHRFAVAGGQVAEGLQDGGLLGQAAESAHDSESVLEMGPGELRAERQRRPERGLGAGLVVRVLTGGQESGGPGAIVSPPPFRGRRRSRPPPGRSGSRQYPVPGRCVRRPPGRR